MCGRFTLRKCPEEVLDAFEVDAQLEWEPRFNIAPSQAVAVIRNAANGGYCEAVRLRWGLVPSWADDLRIGNRMINARAETVVAKPAFRQALQLRRCVVLADGFYEWQRAGKTRQPYFIEMSDHRPFVFAGLWERWAKVSPPVESCTIITTASNGLLAELHDRMPALLSTDAVKQWLDSNLQDASRLASLLTPYPGRDLTAHPVSTIVNSPLRDLPECVQNPTPLF